jgi:hypothetical protein
MLLVRQVALAVYVQMRHRFAFAGGELLEQASSEGKKNCPECPFSLLEIV